MDLGGSSRAGTSCAQCLHRRTRGRPFNDQIQRESGNLGGARYLAFQLRLV